ncbi:glycosyl hydrolase [Bacteroides faecalis]|nr:glycosyl hydrolase [Bacteroides faecalis]
MRTAGELDIEVGMFNSPGWTQAGGPWGETRRVDAIPEWF